MNNEINDNIKKKIRLDTSRHVKRFLQSVINDYNNDIIPDLKAKTLSTLLNSFIKLLDTERNETSITNETEMNYLIERLNEYLKPSNKKISIVSTIDENLTLDETKKDLENFVRILGGKIIWD